jgi:hypothetical protein
MDKSLPNCQSTQGTQISSSEPHTMITYLYLVYRAASFHLRYKFILKKDEKKFFKGYRESFLCLIRCDQIISVWNSSIGYRIVLLIW